VSTALRRRVTGVVYSEYYVTGARWVPSTAPVGSIGAFDIGLILFSLE